MTDRIDRLIDEALTTGQVPEAATNAERDEIEAALRAASMLRTSRQHLDREAASTLPTARARFERFVGQSAQPAARPGPAARRPGIWSNLLTRPRFAVAGGVASLVVLVALVAVVGPQFIGDGVETANAQVLEPGDYVQVQGVVREATESDDGRQLVLDSSFGPVTVDVSTSTQVGDDVGTAEPGDTVAVAGVAATGRRIAASTLVHASVAEPVRNGDVHVLHRIDGELQGRILTFTLSPNGQRGRVLLETADGRRVLVPVDPRGAERLMFLTRVLGAEIRVTEAQGTGGAPYSVEVTREPDSEQPGSLRFAGVVTGYATDVLAVTTARGPVRVAITDATRILPGPSGLTRQQIRAGEGVEGHGIAISGGIDRQRGAIVADVIALGEHRPSR